MCRIGTSCDRTDDTALTSLETARRIAALCEEKLATDVAILDMRAVCDYTDYFVIATGKNPRQTSAIHDEVLARLKADHRLFPRSTSGLPEATTTSTSSSTSSRRRPASTTASRISGTTSRSSRPQRPPDTVGARCPTSVGRRTSDICSSRVSSSDAFSILRTWSCRRTRRERLPSPQ